MPLVAPDPITSAPGYQRMLTLQARGAALQALIGRVFDGIALRRLEAEVDPRNVRSAQLLLRLGFTKEGLLRQRWITKGVATDVEVYGLLRHEWSGDTPS